MESCAECGEPITLRDRKCSFCGTATPWAAAADEAGRPHADPVGGYGPAAQRPQEARGDGWAVDGADRERTGDDGFADAPLRSRSASPARALVRAGADGLLTLAVVAVLSTAAVAAVAALFGPGHRGGPHDWMVSAVLLVAGALGAPTRIAYTVTIPDFGGGRTPLSVSAATSLHATVWLITLAVLLLSAFFARRGETRAPSTTRGRLLARALAPAVVFTAALYALCLAFTATDLFGLLDVTSGPAATLLDNAAGSSGGPPSLSARLSAAGPWLLLGPPLAVFAASCAGRLRARVHRGSLGPVGRLVEPWRGAAAGVWLQLRTVGLLAAVVGTAYAIHLATGESGWSGHAKAAALAASVALAGNFATAGTLLGFGAGVGTGVTTGIDIDGAAQGSTHGFGLFGGQHPAILFALLAAAVAGTLLPALRLPGRGRSGGPAPDYAPAGAWRATVLGALAGALVALLGQAQLSVTLGLAGQGGFYVHESVLGAAVGGALWCTAAYLLVALRARHKPDQPVAAVREPELATE